MIETKQKVQPVHLSVSVIIAAFNEHESLENVVNGINSVLVEVPFKDYEIIIIDDGSTDGTEKIADELENKYSQIRVIHHDRNKGLGMVYRTGFNHAIYDYITFYPADGQFPASNIHKFIPLMRDYDMILGYLPDRKSSMIARFLSKVERFLFSLAFGELPKFQGLFMLRRKVLDDIELKSPDSRAWTIVMELVIRLSKNGYRMISIPTKMRPRAYGKSKVNNFKTILTSLKQLVSLYQYL